MPDAKVENDRFKLDSRYTNDLAVDVVDTSPDIEDVDRVSILVQGGPKGYQMDAFWDVDDVRRQSNNWARFGEGGGDTYDNRHDRDPELGMEDGHPVIVDPDPRAENLGFRDAKLHIIPHDEERYLARLEWYDRKDTKHVTESHLPIVDPRVDKKRYYELLE